MATVAPGQTVRASIAGTLAGTFSTTSMFRERAIQQLLMQGFDVLRLTIEADYGWIEREYRATVELRPLAVTSTDRIVGQVRSAFEGAGSYTPTITITSAGQAEQQAPPKSPIGSTIENLIEGIGVAGRNIADAPKDLTRSVNLVVLGIVVLGVAILFGPNTGTIAKAIPLPRSG